MRKFQKWLQLRTARNVVLTLAVVDGVGLYAAHVHMSRPSVPDEAVMEDLARSDYLRDGTAGAAVGGAVDSSGAAMTDASYSWLPEPAFGRLPDQAGEAEASRVDIALSASGDAGLPPMASGLDRASSTAGLTAGEPGYLRKAPPARKKHRLTVSTAFADIVAGSVPVSPMVVAQKSPALETSGDMVGELSQPGLAVEPEAVPVAYDEPMDPGGVPAGFGDSEEQILPAAATGQPPTQAASELEPREASAGVRVAVAQGS